MPQNIFLFGVAGVMRISSLCFFDFTFLVDISTLTRAYKPTYNWESPHCMVVSSNGGTPSHHPFLDGIFHSKPSILGIPHLVTCFAVGLSENRLLHTQK